MNDPSLEEIQMIEEAHRATRPRISERKAHDELTEAMARFLHYQEMGEPDWNSMTAADIAAHTSELPPEIIRRYFNEAKFHAQVDRAVATVLDIQRRAVSGGSRT